MKKILLAFLIVSFFTLSVKAQEEDYSEYAKEGWHALVENAFEESQQTGKPILANFTGSDWCGWCKRLSAAVFNKPEFKQWADENVVLLELDFPRRKKLPQKLLEQNAGLQQAFKVRGYPTIWVFDLQKNEETGKFSIAALGKTGYKPTVEEFTSDIDAMIAKAGSQPQDGR